MCNCRVPMNPRRASTSPMCFAQRCDGESAENGALIFRSISHSDWSPPCRLLFESPFFASVCLLFLLCRVDSNSLALCPCAIHVPRTLVLPRRLAHCWQRQSKSLCQSKEDKQITSKNNFPRPHLPPREPRLLASVLCARQRNKGDLPINTRHYETRKKAQTLLR